MREVKDFRNSNEDSICLLTDEEGFDKFANYISENNTNKKFNKQTRYEYGSYKIILKNKDGEVLVYVIDDNYESIYFLRRMKEYIRLNNLDINLSKKIEYIIPNSKESGLK